MCDDSSINPFETLFKMSSASSHQNPISELDYDYGPLFFNEDELPSPFLDEDHELPLSQILSQYDQIMNQNHSAAHNVDENSVDPAKEEETKITNTNANSSKLNGVVAAQQRTNGVLRRRNLAEIPRNRTCKKDRHSKIRTAQGFRDRRIRLSLQIARKFFDLQDLLGHDKASNTIEWLLDRSRNAIEELVKDRVISGIEETKSINDVNEKSRTLQKDEKIKLQKRVSKPNTRESREKARTRARCRTREKMMMKNTEDSSHILCKSSSNHLDLDNLFDDFPLLEQELFDIGIVEKLLGTD